MGAITNSFKIYAWGNGGYGRLGHEDTTGISSPKIIKTLSSEIITNASYGNSHTAAISTTGTVYCWGSSTYGKLGHGSECNYYISTPVSALQGERMYMVACGFKYNLALSIHVEVFAWRAGKFGVTGLFDLKKIRTMLIPLKIQNLEGKKVTQIAIGAWHSITINSCLLYTSPSPRDRQKSRMPSSA